MKKFTVQEPKLFRKEWDEKLCSCSVWSEFCCACLCPCHVFGKSTAYLDDSHKYCYFCCCNFAARMFGLGWLMEYYYRGVMRTKYSLKGGHCDDCCLHFCCSSCALNQESVQIEVELSKLYVKQLKDMNGKNESNGDNFNTSNEEVITTQIRSSNSQMIESSIQTNNSTKPNSQVVQNISGSNQKNRRMSRQMSSNNSESRKKMSNIVGSSRGVVLYSRQKKTPKPKSKIVPFKV